MGATRMEGVNIGVAGDTQAFDKAVRTGMIEPLDDAADALRKLDAGGDLAKTERGLRDAQDASKRLEKELDDVVDKLKETGRAGRKAGDDIRKGAKEGEEGVDQAKENIASNAKEIGASFDGTIEGLTDGIQGLLAEMTEGFGPAGLAIGVGLAAGIGIAVAQGQAMADAVNEAKERAGDLALEIADAGGRLDQVDLAGKMREWGVEIADSREFWELWQESAVTNIEKAQQKAREFTVDAGDMFRAMSGLDADSSQRVLEQLNRQLEENERQMSANAAVNPFAGFGDNAALDFRNTALRTQITELERVAGITRDASEMSKALGISKEEQAAAIEEASTATREENAELAENASRLMASMDANLALIEAKERAKKTIEENGATLDHNTEAGRANERAVLEVARASLAAADALKVNGNATEESNAKTKELRQGFIDTATAAGYTREQAAALADQYGFIPKQIATEVRLQRVAEVTRELDTVTADRNTAVRLGLDSSEYERRIRDLLNVQRVQTILVREQRETGSGRMGVP